MRAVVQRVRAARIRVGDETVGQMDDGLLALVGVAHGDGPAEADELARKLVHLRVFEDDEQRMNRSILDLRYALGVVSQFTLLGDVRKGRRPSFGDAAPPEHAEPLIERLVQQARAFDVTVVTGRFRATMSVELTNDGPVTLLLDTEKRF